MQNLLLSAGIILPLFTIMTLGHLCRNILKLSSGWVQTTNKMLFRIMLPMLLFRSMYSSDFTYAFTPDMLKMCLLSSGGLVLSFLVLCIIVPRLEKKPERRGVIIQGAYRANTAIFGIPIALALYEESAITPVAMALAFAVPTINILSVIVLEMHRDGKPQWRKILKNIATNPPLISIVLGIAFNLLNINLPGFVKSAAWALADCTTPLSFFILGASFSFSAAASNRKVLLWCVLTKLVIIPVVFLSIAVGMGFRGAMLVAVLITFAPPTAVSSFPMAQAVGADAELASEIVVFTSVFSLITIFLFLSGLGFLGLL
ncbi:AEC family transporter [Eubacteriales bacterium OttesenSCG-928-K08]|nr:AEC family transporter [Eubacteriales bacterium OttesenSCG-928-K08]